jgi:Na+-driven multidrug efflux pump
MLTNAIGGLQGMVDHALVGNLVGYQANAAIGVAWQIFLMVLIFITSLFTGMSVLVARFVGAGEEEKVNRTVYQAFLTAIFISLGIVAPIGYAASPVLLDLVNAAPNVKAEALPFLRIMFVFSSGMMIFFMLGGALCSAGDARTPLVLGVVMTILNLVLKVILIRELGPVPALGTAGAAMGTRILRELWLCMHSLSCGAGVGSCRFRAKASVRIGASFARFFDSACRPAFRESR